MRDIALISILAFVTSAALAGEEPAVDRSDIQGGQKAVLLKNHKPSYPPSEIAKSGEGWAFLYYNIDEQGIPTDIVPAEFAGPHQFVDTAVESLKRWRYTPATSQGVPVPQFGNAVRYVFMSENAERVLTTQRLNLANAVRKQIQDGQLAASRAELKQAFASNLNVYEISLFNVLRAELAQAEKKYSEEIQYLKRARYAGKMLSDQANRAILARMFIAAARAQDVDTGIDVFEDLTKIKREIKEWSKFVAVHQEMMTLRDSQAPLATRAVILDDGIGSAGIWTKPLHRRAFEFEKLSGNFTKFELRCEKKYFTANVDAGRSWQVTPNWGDCTILVYGDVGASLTLQELPSQASVPSDASVSKGQP